MNFKRYQFLKQQALAHLKESKDRKPLLEEEALPLDSLLLAYIGDAVYSLYVRDITMSCGIYKVRVLHDIVTAIICAKAQAEAYDVLEAEFTEAELAVAKRARNSNVNVPKSATLQEYRYSTAFEAVLGYLHITGNKERLEAFMAKAYETSLEKVK